MGEKKHKLLKKIALNKKTKQNLLLVALGAILVIITIIIVMTSANSNVTTYSYTVGDIKTSVAMNTAKQEIIITANVQGQKISQTCAYEQVEGDDTSINGTYEIYLDNGDRVEIVINDNKLTLIYPDGDPAVLTKE